MHFGQADLLARIGDAGFLIGLLRSDAGGVEIASIPAAAMLQFPTIGAGDLQSLDRDDIGLGLEVVNERRRKQRHATSLSA